MPRATHTHTTPAPGSAPQDMSRRRLMSAAAGAAFAGAALVIAAPTEAQPAAGDDAELLEALAEFDALERRIGSCLVGADALEDEEAREVILAPLEARQNELLGSICTLRATTPAGWRARARSLVLWDSRDEFNITKGDDPDGYLDQRMMVALLRDLVGETVA